MGAVNFYLKKAEKSSGKSLIYLQFKYNGNKLLYSFGQTINPKNWNDKKQRVKSNTQTTADKQYLLNDLLDNLKKECENAYNKEIKNGIPQPQVLKKYLVSFINQNKPDSKKPNLYKLINRFIDGEIMHKGKRKSKGTLKSYKTVYNHLQAFEQKKRYKIDFDTINIDFNYKYQNYLDECGFSQNNKAQHIKIIKVFMNEAVDLGYTTNFQFRHKKFTAPWVDVDSVYLSDLEIIKLFKLDLTANKRLEQVRDLFVFGCFVGLRFGDYSEVKPENIITIDGELFVKMITQKTGEEVIIPCSPVVLQIFKKYSSNVNRLPNSISNQKFNDYIKEVCKQAEFTEKGRLISKPDKSLYECISSHTCRRSFATNLYLESFPPIEIMKITGHRTETAFLKYIKVTKLDAAKRLSAHIKNMWSKKILQAVG